MMFIGSLFTGKEGKQMGVPMDPSTFLPAVRELCDQVQESLLAAATTFRDANIVDVTTYEELKAVVAEGGWIGSCCNTVTEAESCR
jgi:prolyl-tRNA synthetase